MKATETKAQDQGEHIHSVLKSIYYLSSFGLLDDARERLAAYENNEDYWLQSTDGHTVFEYFLKAKIEFQEYKVTSLVTHLEQSQRHLDDMVNFSRGAEISLKSPKYLQLRIHVAHCLSQEVNDELRRTSYASGAEHLAGIGLDKYPDVAAFSDLYIMVVGDKLNSPFQSIKDDK